MEKDKIEKALKKAGGVEEINWSNLKESEELNGIVYELQSEELLKFDIEHLMVGCSSDYAITYYSEKLCKTIIFDYDAQTSFEDFDEFVKWVDRLNKEVVEFEKNITGILTKKEKQLIKNAFSKDFSLGNNYETIIKKLGLFKE